MFTSKSGIHQSPRTKNHTVTSNTKVLHILHHFHPDLQAVLSAVGLDSDNDRFYQAQSSIYRHLELEQLPSKKELKSKLNDRIRNLGNEKIEVSIKVLFEETESLLPNQLIVHHPIDGFLIAEWEKQYRLLGLEPHFLLLYTPVEWAVEQRVQNDIEGLKSTTKLIWQLAVLRKFQRTLAKRQQKYLQTWKDCMQGLKIWTQETSSSFSMIKIDDINSETNWENFIKSYNLKARNDFQIIHSRKYVGKYADPEIQAIHDYFYNVVSE